MTAESSRTEIIRVRTRVAAGPGRGTARFCGEGAGCVPEGSTVPPSRRHGVMGDPETAWSALPTGLAQRANLYSTPSSRGRSRQNRHGGESFRYSHRFAVDVKGWQPSVDPLGEPQ